MQVYKFGGASVKNAQCVQRLGDIVSRVDSKLIVVVSAMGKMTNYLEKLVDLYLDNINYYSYLRSFEEYHLQICNVLFLGEEISKHKDFISELISELEDFMRENVYKNRFYIYDQIVSKGEILSTYIISEYLKLRDFNVKLLDAREIILTDSSWQEARVDFRQTGENLRRNIFGADADIYVIQGFIGGNDNGVSTTLGREGSDYTASIIAYLLNLQSVTVWKDVDGIYNCDPKFDNNAVILPEISYKEAIELAYYGGKIIHPRTIQPIENKKIPLYVRSFINYDAKGTVIKADCKAKISIPIYIVEKNQILISLTSGDFSFIAEENLSVIFKKLSELRLKINIMQNSAIQFAMCLDYNKIKIDNLIDDLKSDYIIRYNTNVELVTIRYYNSEIIDKLLKNKDVLLEQFSRLTARFVLKDNI